MKHWAIGWACNLNDLFIRFPYEKYKSIIKKYKLKLKLKQIVKQVFTEGLKTVFNDIIENNVSFKVPGIGYLGGDIYIEAIKDYDFEIARKNGKFQDIDFLESLFTGYLMYLHIHGKRDNFLARRKFPIYLGKEYRQLLTKYTNEGKKYC